MTDIIKMARLYWAASDAEIVALQARKAKDDYLAAIGPELIAQAGFSRGDIVTLKGGDEALISSIGVRIRWPHKLEVVAQCHHTLKTTGGFSKRADLGVILHATDLHEVVQTQADEASLDREAAQ